MLRLHCAARWQQQEPRDNGSRPAILHMPRRVRLHLNVQAVELSIAGKSQKTLTLA